MQQKSIPIYYIYIYIHHNVYVCGICNMLHHHTQHALRKNRHSRTNALTTHNTHTHTHTQRHTHQTHTHTHTHTQHTQTKPTYQIGSVRSFSQNARFASQLVQFGDSERVSAKRVVSIGSVRGFKATFSRVNWVSSGNFKARSSRVNWFSSGIQSAFRESIGSVSGIQSAFRESIGLVRGFIACFVSQLVQFGASECVSRVNWFRSGL